MISVLSYLFIPAMLRDPFLLIAPGETGGDERWFKARRDCAEGMHLSKCCTRVTAAQRKQQL